MYLVDWNKSALVARQEKKAVVAGRLGDFTGAFATPLLGNGEIDQGYGACRGRRGNAQCLTGAGLAVCSRQKNRMHCSKLGCAIGAW